MKKLLLYCVSVMISFSSFAQVNKIVSAKEVIKKRDAIRRGDFISYPTSGSASPISKPEVQRGQPNTSQTATVIPIGTSANVFTTIGVRSNIDYNPDINTVTFIHRSDPANGLGTTTGEYYFDVSTDGGATWTVNQGPLYNNPGDVNRGRYPNAVIYNPQGNTNPANGFITYYGPCTGGAGWISDVHGTGNLTGPVTSTNVVTVHPYPDGTDLVVPDGMVITKATGETYLYDPKLTNELTTGYSGILQIRHGVWNGTNDMNYNTVFVSLPVSVDPIDTTADFASTSNVAFANDGLKGYAMINGHYDYSANPDSSYFIILSNTTDGGVTWSTPYYLTLSAIDGLLNNSGNGKYIAWLDDDAVVDMNGNLHIITTIGALGSTGYSINTAVGETGVFDVYTTDGGTTWKAEFLGEPQAFSVQYTGGTSTDRYFQRGQASRTWAGDKVFFSWFDTDTALFATGNNEFPDLHMRAYDVANNMWTSAMNLTQGSAADGACTYGNVGPIVIGSSGTYKIPATFSTILTDISGPVAHNYIDGLNVNDADFNVQGNPVTLTAVTAITNPGTIGGATNIYPNPSRGDCYMALNLNEASKVSVSFINIMGQEVAVQQMGNLNVGQNTLKLDTRNLSKGIYMVNIKAGVNNIVRKLTVN